MTSSHVQGVLDLTFLEISEEADVERGLSERLPLMTSPSPTKSKKSEEIKAIRLANNAIENIEILSVLSRHFDCSTVAWIDLSFNTISKIDEGFGALFPNLTTIYLHANQISRLSEIRKLSIFANLKSVSLYGNPVQRQDEVS